MMSVDTTRASEVNDLDLVTPRPLAFSGPVVTASQKFLLVQATDGWKLVGDSGKQMLLTGGFSIEEALRIQQALHEALADLVVG